MIFICYKLSVRELKDKEAVVESLLRIIEPVRGAGELREGIEDTPKRVIKSYEELFGGYKLDPKKILSTSFENTKNYHDIVILKDIDFFSTCEHHLLPFFGKVDVAYIPEGKVVGLSKLARIVHCFSRRLQIQEKLGQEIMSSISKYVKTKDVFVKIEAEHFCMKSRGVRTKASKMVTISTCGKFREQSVKIEVLQSI